MTFTALVSVYRVQFFSNAVLNEEYGRNIQSPIHQNYKPAAAAAPNFFRIVYVIFRYSIVHIIAARFVSSVYTKWAHYIFSYMTC